MPINEREFHPFLELGYSIKNPKGLILGTFPVYELTNPQTKDKREKREKNKSQMFFYGSSRSSLWKFYKENVDKSIELPVNPDTILNSLQNHNIAISDLYVSCDRATVKAEDKGLSNFAYNDQGILNLIENGVTRILCTSKDVLVCFEKEILCNKKNAKGLLDIISTKNFQGEFVDKLSGDEIYIPKPIAKVFRYKSKNITCLAVPSPGAPYRQAHNFGFNNKKYTKAEHRKKYVDQYFKLAFNWLTFKDFI